MISENSNGKGPAKDSLEIYLRQINETSLLSATKEKETAWSIKHGFAIQEELFSLLKDKVLDRCTVESNGKNGRSTGSDDHAEVVTSLTNADRGLMERFTRKGLQNVRSIVATSEYDPPVKYSAMQKLLLKTFAELDGEDFSTVQRKIIDLNKELTQLSNGAFPYEDQEVTQESIVTVIHSAEDSRSEMIKANLRLVVSIAKKYQYKGMPFQDLIEVGNLGLMKAVVDFEPERDIRFSTYATYWIKQSIRRALGTKVKTIHIPQYAEQLAQKFTLTLEDLIQRGKSHGNEDVFRVMGIKEKYRETIERALALRGAIRVDEHDFDLPSDDADNSREQGLERKETLAQIDNILDTFDQRERDMFCIRNGLRGHTQLTLKETGELFGLTRERVRQITEKTASIIRDTMLQSEITKPRPEESHSNRTGKMQSP